MNISNNPKINDIKTVLSEKFNKINLVRYTFTGHSIPKKPYTNYSK